MSSAFSDTLELRSFCAHHLLYTEAAELAGSIQSDPTMLMIIINRQIRRANAPAAAPKQYYKINLTRVFLDHAIQQLDIRFKAQVHICYKGLSIIPSILLGQPMALRSGQNYMKSNIRIRRPMQYVQGQRTKVEVLELILKHIKIK